MCIRDRDNNVDNTINSEIAYVTVHVNGIKATAMIDTGSNVSLIDKLELNRILAENKTVIPTLPINNIVLIGATGRQNKTIRNQVQLEISSNGETIPMIFLVASGLPFNLLIGCDILRRYAAVINMSRANVSLSSGDIRWTAELIGSQKANPDHIIYYIREDHDQRRCV